MIVILRYIVEGMILIGAGVKWLDMFVKRYNLPPILQRMKNMKKIFFSILVVGLVAELIVYKLIIPEGVYLFIRHFQLLLWFNCYYWFLCLCSIWGTNGMR